MGSSFSAKRLATSWFNQEDAGKAARRRAWRSRATGLGAQSMADEDTEGGELTDKRPSV